MAKARKKAAKPSTALAVRPKKKAAPVVTIADPKGLLPQSPIGQLGELATVGALGLAEIRLTDAEEAVLSKPVDPSQIQFKPKKKDGPPEIPYLPHIVYTRWMNEAFGRTGWSLVPTAQPKKVDNLILVPYLLYIHGIPVAAATGEQEYYESNKQQTYGDVIESTIASALRRCAKRLGIGLELWDKDWLAVHAIPPHLRGSHRYNTQSWTQGSRPDQEALGRPVIDAEPVSQPDTGEGAITTAQRKRLDEIRTRAGREAAEVSLWLRKRYGVTSSKAIRQADYKAICAQMEARGPLVMPGDGQ